MNNTTNSARRRMRSAFIALSLLTCAAGTQAPAAAQERRAIRSPETPLVLKSRGSFFVGGEKAEQNAVQLGSLGPDDQITKDQMYVEYMVPERATGVPVVMIHGATLSGKTYDTTPDGRMGWYEYFVRKAHPVYVVDQVGRARSGFDQSIYNDVRAGRITPDKQPNMLRLGDRFGAWTNFRIGPEPGKPFPGTQFPVEAIDQMSKQSVPDLLGTSRAANPTWKALSDLSADLGGAVLLSHSQSGPFPLKSALIDARGIRGIVMVEPGTCSAQVHTSDEIARLAKIPIFILFGDYLSADTKLPGPSWADRLNDCQAFKKRIDAVGGNVRILAAAEGGLAGSSHMMMMDKNNLQIGDLILAWIRANVPVR